MPYKREIARKSKQVISENIRNYLLTGELSQDADVFQLSGNRKRFSVVWQAVKKEILPPFIKNNPCTRPFAFWLCAPEPRKIIGGSGAWAPGMAVDEEGLPRYSQLNWKKKDPPIFESQATYLERLDLLMRTEKLHLKKHSKLLKAEIVEFSE